MISGLPRLLLLLWEESIQCIKRSGNCRLGIVALDHTVSDSPVPTYHRTPETISLANPCLASDCHSLVARVAPSLFIREQAPLYPVCLV
jgi:hypothetical protein